MLSFPLLTRSLSVEDYGLLGLVSATVTIFVSFAKLGLQSAVLRFFGEAKAAGASALHSLLSNIAGAALILSLLGTLLWLLYALLGLPLIDDTPLLQKLFLIATALIPIKIAHSLLANTLQADEQSHTISTITVAEKLFRLLGLFTLVAMIGLTSERALKLIIVSECLFLVVIFFYSQPYLNQIKLRLQPAVLAPLVAYGLPAMIAELTAVLLETGDRYVIQAYMGAASLGLYAAAVNICMYLEWVLILALQSAIVPHYVKIFAENGRSATLSFLNNAFTIYIAVGVGVFVVFCIAAPQLVLFLAGEKYRDGLLVIPWFAAGYLLVGAISIAAAGVFIDKRTGLLVKWTGIAFVINMILNLIFIPLYGLLAAAIATFIAMCIRSIGVYFDARKSLPVVVPWRTLIQALGCAIPAYLLGIQIQTDFSLLTMIAGSAITGSVYITAMLMLNPTLRIWLFDKVHNFIAK